MKKSLSLLLVFALILSAFVGLSGCASEDGTEGDALTVCIVVSTGFGDKSLTTLH